MGRLKPTMIGKQVGRNVTRRLKNSAKNLKPTRLIAGATLGATAATLGLAAGVASGDPTKALSFAAAGAVAGNKAGRGAASVLGIDEAVGAVNEANMTDQERKELKRQKVLDSNDYQMARDKENKAQKAILDAEMSDGRTLREAFIDEKLSHDEQLSAVKYMEASGAGEQVQEDVSAATDMFNEITNIKKLSDNLGVTNLGGMTDLKRKKSIMEDLAQQVDPEAYQALEEKEKKARVDYDVAQNEKFRKQRKNETNEEFKLNKRKFEEAKKQKMLNIQKQIDNIQNQKGSTSGAREIQKRLDRWGKSL